MSDQDVDLERRRFLTQATAVIGGVGCVAAGVAGVMYMSKSERALALGAPTEVNISKLKPGEQITADWRSQPIWILHRTPEMLENLKKYGSDLKDPNSDSSEQPAYAKNYYRSIRKDIFLVIGICTHLGCSPRRKTANADDMGADWHGGYLCACHGSKFDYAGRVVKGSPAPTNLVVPKHMYSPQHKDVVIIGVESESSSKGAKS